MTTPYIVDLDGSSPGSRELLGGKAYSVNKMRSLGLPVPAAFALTTPVCAVYHGNGAQLPDEIWSGVLEHLAKVEEATGRRFGVGPFPLLLSVRSGAAQSMPGMMDTVLNLGLTEQLTEDLAAATGDRRWAQDTWGRFCTGYADIVLGRPGAQPPADPYDQLRAAIGAVFDSWTNDRVAAYRKRHGLGAGTGTAVTIQAMVFGNRDEQSGTGVLFSRDPGTGENVLFGEWLACAQGEDVVSGERTPSLLTELAETLPEQHAALQLISTNLEVEHRDLVDVEFTIESGRLFVLQCRSGKRSARAAVRIAVDLVHEGMITKDEALDRITVEHAARLAEHSGISSDAVGLAGGTGASPGSACGVAFNDLELAMDAAAAGTSVVLVRPSTAPDDVPAMFDSVAVVTEVGGTTSHAALVCREIGLPCVVGCGTGTVDALVGKTITVDGSAGIVYEGNVLESGSTVDDHLTELLTYLPDEISPDHRLAALAALRLEGAQS